MPHFLFELGAGVVATALVIERTHALVDRLNAGEPYAVAFGGQGASWLENLEELVSSAGIESEVEVAVDHHPSETENAPQKVLVPESSLEAAQHAIESLTEPEELVDEQP